MSEQSGRGLYLHIPFCHQRCHFCAFYLEIHQPQRTDEFVNALLQEIRIYADLDPFCSTPLDSAYLGGGTPTVLASDRLGAILSTVGLTFGIRDRAEITVEAHPGTVTERSLTSLLEASFKRLSIGDESMNQRKKALVGRPGTPLETRRAVKAARTAGFRNICLDLIYGLPGQTNQSWAASLERAIALEPTHVSCYALTVEEGTHLERGIRRGTVTAPDPILQNELEDEAEERLSAAGFQRYEISNYARPGYASRHNLLYWQGGRYLGLGPSAQSYIGNRRFGNLSDLEGYQASLRSGSLPIVDAEELSPVEQALDRLIFGLRLIDGLSLADSGLEEAPGFSQAVQPLIAERLVAVDEGKIRLTRLGRRFADSVAVRLLAGLGQEPAGRGPISSSGNAGPYRPELPPMQSR